jgi:hypothetical protein
MHSHKCVFFAITNTVWGIGKQAQVEKKHEMDLNIHTLWIYIHGSTIQKKKLSGLWGFHTNPGNSNQIGVH